MITLVSRDREIYDLEYRVADILYEYQLTGKVDISTRSEGICLEKSGFYKLLDYICDKFKIDKKCITITTANSLEQHKEYSIKILYNYWLANWVAIKFNQIETEKTSQLKHLGCFSGRVNWNRLILVSWLYTNFKETCLLSFNYNNSDEDKLISDLNRLNFYQSSSLEQAVVFLKNAPLILEKSRYSKPDDINDFINKSMEMSIYYKFIFLDLVLETYCMGNTFFPTEKTLRPIVTKTPFIVMGPPNYLKNLKKLGFKTFDLWWNESYDLYEGSSRIDEIKKVITEIMLWPQEKLQKSLQEMESVLEYNRTHYLNGINYEQKHIHDCS